MLLSDDFGHIHSFEHVKLRFVCGGAIFFVVFEIWYFLNSLASTNKNWRNMNNTWQYSDTNMIWHNKLKMFDFNRFIVWFNISIVERVNSSMIINWNKTSGELIMKQNIWEWLTKNELKILFFGRESPIFDFDLMYFLDLSSILDFGTIFRFGFGFGFGFQNSNFWVVASGEWDVVCV